MAGYAGKRILITGGSTGIGLVMAVEFARRGARLVLAARDAGKLKLACAACREAGGEASYVTCDVMDKHAVRQAVNAAAAQLGGLDGVIANSGYCHPGYFHEIALEDADQQIDTNLKGVIYTVHAAVPHLLPGGGFIAITSSPAGTLPIFGFSLYGATKAALNHLAHTLRHEYESRGINVHLLLPPDTDTPGYQQEITLYPRETKAVLSGGRLFDPALVGRVFVDGMARGRKHIVVGNDVKLAMLVTRYWPGFWELYSARAVKKSRKA